MDLKQFSDQLTQKKNSLTTARINYKLGLLNLKNQTLWDFEAVNRLSHHHLKHWSLTTKYASYLRNLILPAFALLGRFFKL
jgi:hypothetical protein